MTTSYTREGLRPEVRALFDSIVAARPPQRELAAAAMRAADPLLAMMFNAGAPTVAREEEIRIPTPAGEMRALVFAGEPAGGRALPVLLYMHGGGFVIMSPETTARITKQLALEAGALVFSIDYRRAPEHPYPAPLDDCAAAYRWLKDRAASLGGDPSRIAVAGDSAGGNLAAALSLRLLAEGDEPPAAVGLTCAWTDLAMATRSFAAFGPDDLLIDDATMRHWRSCYAPDSEQWAQPLVSPLRGDLSSFPPACVVVGGIDPLYDDGVQFAERLRTAGRAVELHEYDGMPHDFMLFPALAAITDASERTGAFLRRALAAG
ncbi:MAG: alpha/beta hydrolase [Dehalococcoidia bacterium]|nr:alpha/beta hydrolase [Dehalococcoidia bacterium]